MKTLVTIAAVLLCSMAHAGGRPVRPTLNPQQRPPAPAAPTRSQPKGSTGDCVMLKAVGGGWWYPPCMR